MDPHPRPGPHGRPWLPDPGRPVLRAIMIVVAVGPQHHEDALAPDEPGRRVVAEPLGHLRQRQADRPDPPGWIGCHRAGGVRRRGVRTLMRVRLAGAGPPSASSPVAPEAARRPPSPTPPTGSR